MEHPPTSDNQDQDPAVAPEAAPPKFRVKFADGPARGMTREYEKEMPTYKVGTWTYEATGQRDGDFWLYVKRLTQRVDRRVLRMVNATRPMDVRLFPKDEPTVVIHRGRNDLCWCGSGRKYKKCHASPQSS